MTKEQIRRECERMRGLLEAYDAEAGGLADHHQGLKKRLQDMEQRLAVLEKG